MTDTDTSSAPSSAVPTDLNYGYFIGDCPVKSENEFEDHEGGSLNSSTHHSQFSVDASEQQEQGKDKTEQESDSNSSESNSGGSSSSSSSSSSSNEQMEFVVKLRGLPWSCTKDDVVDFLGSECKILGDADGIHMITTPEGKASGEAMVVLASEEDLGYALDKHKRNMAHRYIEVFKITKSEMDWVLKRSRPVVSSNGNSGSFGGGGGGGRSVGSNSSDTFARLRGLPYECTKEDIHHFFHGLEIVSNGISLMVDGMGRSSGEAYVQFATKEQAHKALGKDREMIKHRYVEIFTVSPTELRNIQSMVARVPRGSSVSSRPSPYDRPGNRGSDSRYGGSGRQSRYFNKGFENDSWNSYDSWGGGGGTSGRSNNMNPPPLIPGLKRSREVEGNTRHCVLMRGLPYRADENDIRRFFAPLSPTAVHIIFESSGRPSGTAKVNFASNDDVTRAMAKHKDRMEHRYIELFYHRT